MYELCFYSKITPPIYQEAHQELSSEPIVPVVFDLLLQREIKPLSDSASDLNTHPSNLVRNGLAES